MAADGDGGERGVTAVGRRAGGNWLWRALLGLRRTEKAWFGPKRYLGWGWTVTSWEGGVVAAVYLVVVVACLVLWQSRVAVVVATLVLLGVTVVTGDPPGGPSAWRDDRSDDPPGAGARR